MSLNGAYDRRRAVCENHILSRSWVERVKDTKAKYSICFYDFHKINTALVL
jgi:hypothetical protein